ncbi:LPS translocon maturation chaperone LptM [Thaumasiovibrio subtropicus]|nr:lipoprotein [Thaumasiovibrio subtropicus]
MQIRFFTLILLAAMALAGCGQSGPLYMPDETPEEQTEPQN